MHLTRKWFALVKLQRNVQEYIRCRDSASGFRIQEYIRCRDFSLYFSKACSGILLWTRLMTSYKYDVCCTMAEKQQNVLRRKPQNVLRRNFELHERSIQNTAAVTQRSALMTDAPAIQNNNSRQLQFNRYYPICYPDGWKRRFAGFSVTFARHLASRRSQLCNGVDKW